jgi:ribosomal protein S17E
MKKPTVDELLNNKYTEEELEQWTDEFDEYDWRCISECYSKRLSESFIDKYADKVDWGFISPFARLSESFIEKHQDKVVWSDISAFQFLSEQFIEKHKDKIDWCCLDQNLHIEQTLSEQFIEKYKDKLNWTWICSEQTLSENFMRKHKDLVDWFYVAGCQRFSSAFAVEMVEINDYVYQIENNEKMFVGEKQEIIDTLKIVQKLTA